MAPVLFARGCHVLGQSFDVLLPDRGKLGLQLCLFLVREKNIRPLAKLSKAVKVADTSNQGEAESEAFSPVTVTLGEDTKPFDKTDGVFNKDMFS